MQFLYEVFSTELINKGFKIMANLPICKHAADHIIFFQDTLGSYLFLNQFDVYEDLMVKNSDLNWYQLTGCQSCVFDFLSDTSVKIHYKNFVIFDDKTALLYIENYDFQIVSEKIIHRRPKVERESEYRSIIRSLNCQISSLKISDPIEDKHIIENSIKLVEDNIKQLKQSMERTKVFLADAR